jgi:hypothetical protein
MPRYRYGRRLPGRLPVLFDYWPGRTGAETFSRGSVAYQRRQDLTLQQVANHVLRDAHYETDPIGGGLIRTALLEGQRTNLLTYSEQFDNAAWSKTGVVVTANSVAAPDGASTADTLTYDTGTSSFVRQSYTVDPANATYTFSVWLRAASSRSVRARLDSTSLGTITTWNLTTEWQRFEISRTFAGTDTGNILVNLFNSDPASTVEVYAWGAQLEAASFASSYVKTEGSTATRAAEAPYFDIGFGPQALTVWVDFIARPASGSGAGLQRIFDLGDSQTGQGIGLGYPSAVADRLDVKVKWDTSFVQPNIGGLNLSDSPRIRARIVIRGSEVQFYISRTGAAESASAATAITMPTVLTGSRLTLNAAGNGGDHGFQALRRLTIAPGERDAAFFLSRGN